METVPGKPHPLESAVSRQLDSIDLDEVDDWGIQEVRASVAQGTVSMATNPAKQQTGVGGVSDKRNAVNGEFCSITGIGNGGVLENVQL